MFLLKDVMDHTSDSRGGLANINNYTCLHLCAQKIERYCENKIIIIFLSLMNFEKGLICTDISTPFYAPL